MTKLTRAAIYCRDSKSYGSFEPENPHNTVAYQAGSAMTFIVDKSLTFSGLYVDAADSYTSLERLSRDCARGLIDLVIVRDLDVLSGDDNLLLALEDMISVPFIGVEDLDTTKDDLNIQTLEYEVEERHHTDEHRQALKEAAREQSESRQEDGKFVGRTPYGYLKAGDELIADPKTASVVRKIYDLFLSGHKLNDIRRYLKENEIGSPTGAEWNIPGVKRILQRSLYCGDEHTEALISRETYELANERLSTRTIKKDDQKPDFFPMAVCDICGKKLTYKRSRDLYLCDRHTAELPKEKPLDHAPKITAQELMVEVSRQYNAYLAEMKFLQDKPIWETDLCLEERAEDKIQLGEKLLELDPNTEDYGVNVKKVSDPYAGLWLDWIQTLKNVGDDYYHALIRTKLPDIWRPMYRFDARVVKRSVDEIRLKEDGSVTVHFKAEKAFKTLR